SLVPPDKIGGANALFGSSMAVLHMVGPLLGGLAVSVFGGIREVVFFDVATYFLGLVLLSKFTTRLGSVANAVEGAPAGRYFDDLKEGLDLVRVRPDLRQLMTGTFLCGMAIGILIPLMPPFLQVHQGLGESAYGL